MNELATIKCLIVDDEPPARELIRRYIGQVSSLELIGECANAIDAFSFLQQHKTDLIFLDIQMPQLAGTDFIKSLTSAPKVIFTTAYAEYALEGYELDAVDFLMKPVSFDRFLKAIQKMFRQNKAFQLPVPETAEIKRQDPFVYFRVERKMQKVMLDEILYIESMKDYIKIYTRNGMMITKQFISTTEAMLPDKEFVRCHRSYIVSLKHVRSFTNELLEIGKTQIPIGKLFRNEVMKALG